MKITSENITTILLIVCLILLIFVSGCGSDDCEGVDTSQAPDKIIRGAASDTYIWGSCTKTYQKERLK